MTTHIFRKIDDGKRSLCLFVLRESNSPAGDDSELCEECQRHANFLLKVFPGPVRKTHK